MTEAKKPILKIWLDLDGCERAYRNFRIKWDQANSNIPNIPPFETRYKGGLESLLGTVRTKSLYQNPTIIDIGADYFNRLTRSQVFFDGNKRMAVLFTSIFLSFNRMEYRFTPNELYNLAAIVADSRYEVIPFEISRVVIRDYFIKHVHKI